VYTLVGRCVDAVQTLERRSEKEVAGRHPEHFSLAMWLHSRTKGAFFEMCGWDFHLQHSQTSGNPVRIGDGCATVTGYKLPEPLV
jgi:hypothetical protein